MLSTLRVEAFFLSIIASQFKMQTWADTHHLLTNNLQHFYVCKLLLLEIKSKHETHVKEVKKKEKSTLMLNVLKQHIQSYRKEVKVHTQMNSSSENQHESQSKYLDDLIYNSSMQTLKHFHIPDSMWASSVA